MREKIIQPDFKRESEYAGEVLRLFNLLKTKISEEEATRIVSELEKMAKENDEIVGKILSNPTVMEEYEVDRYDGLELCPSNPESIRAYFIKDGLWKIKKLNYDSLFDSSFFDRDGTYYSEKLLIWFNEDINFNKLCFEQLQKTGDLMITDPAKVRIRKIELGEEDKEKVTLH